MRGGSKRRIGFCRAIVLVSIAGCRQIVDFDEPPPAASDASAGELPEALPFVPFKPRPEYEETCKSCAAQKCSTQHQACVDDPQCRELLRCYGKCSDPLCIARCGSYDLLDYSWGGALPGRRGAESALLSAYQRCVPVYDDCSTECGSGLDWGCLKNNRYRWPHWPYMEKNPLHLQLELLFPGDVGVSARVSAFPPLGSLSREPNGWGQVELEFPGVFDGFLQIESDPDALDEFHVLDFSGPFFRDTRLSRNVFPIDRDPPYPRAGFAGIIIAVTDCVGSPATGITFELEGASGEEAYAYMGPEEMFVPGGKTDHTGAGGFADVSPSNVDAFASGGDATVTVLAKHDGQTVARRTVLLRENWLTSVVLRPLSGDE